MRFNLLFLLPIVFISCAVNAVSSTPENTLSDAERKSLMAKAKTMIRGNCLPFFEKHIEAADHKAFAYAVDEKGRVSCAQGSGSDDLGYLKDSVINSCEAFKKRQGKKGATTACQLFSTNNDILLKPDDFSALLKGLSFDIFELAKTGAPSELEQALASGINVNSRDKFGYTPLLRAVSVNRLDNVKFLVANGADIHLKGNSGFDALNKAVYSRSNNLNIIKFLFDKGADLNTKTKRPGNSPIHHAAELGRMDVLTLLLEKGADVNVKNNYTETPLHKAADQGHVSILKLLLAKGAKINEQTRRGITPLDDALFRKRKEATTYLKSKGALENNPTHK